MQMFIPKGTRVGRVFVCVLKGALLLSARGGETAQLRKFTLGYSRVGPAGTGLWMAKEIGAFEKYGIDAERWRVAVSFAHVCGGRWTARFELDPRLKRSEGRQLLPDPCV
jgi:hypothetical protein